VLELSSCSPGSGHFHGWGNFRQYGGISRKSPIGALSYALPHTGTGKSHAEATEPIGPGR